MSEETKKPEQVKAPSPFTTEKPGIIPVVRKTKKEKKPAKPSQEQGGAK